MVVVIRYFNDSHIIHSVYDRTAASSEMSRTVPVGFPSLRPRSTESEPGYYDDGVSFYRGSVFYF